MATNSGIWVRCKNCKHKLFMVYPESIIKVEVKCHSCKMINFVNLDTNHVVSCDFIVSDNYETKVGA